MNAFCSKCGAALPPAARFCSACGTAVEGLPPQAEGAPYAAPGSAYGTGYGAGYGAGYAPGYGYPSGRLLRPILGRQFAGVCIGMARAYGWDVSIVRIIAVVGGIFLFPIFEIVYVACWIGIPQETLSDVPATTQQF